jgi:hypothetical protein
MKEVAIFAVIIGAILINAATKSQTRKANINKEWIKTSVGYCSIHLN